MASSAHCRLLAHALLDGIGSHRGLEDFVPDVTLLDLMRRLRDVAGAGCVHLVKLHGSFSGALGLLMTPHRSDGQELLTSVLKYDYEDEIVDEATKTTTYSPK